jgi:hypothetical protein
MIFLSGYLTGKLMILGRLVKDDCFANKWKEAIGQSLHYSLMTGRNSTNNKTA